MDSFTLTVCVLAQMSPDLLQVISWVILAALTMNEIFLMKWGFLMCFYFDDKEEEQEIKIRKGENDL